MTTQKPKILLSEGSSLSSREAITALGLGGHRVELVSSNPICLGRFSRFVTRVHQAPASGADPDGYLAAVIEIVKTYHIDALIPVQEQAYLFAASRKQLPAVLGIALADFEAFEQVQSKASFASLLTRLKVPQPTTEIIRSADEFAAERPYPFFVKAAFGTASAGVWRVGDLHQRDALLVQLQALDAFAHGLLVQAAVTGALERTQAVFDRGRLVASHIYRQVVEGPGGGDVLKISVVNAGVRDTVERIGQALKWHGALSFDYILDDATHISLGETPPAQPDGREGILTRLGLMGLLDAARRRSRRRDILREIGLLAAGSGRYRGSREELVPLLTDPWCAIPLGVVVARLLRAPATAARFSETTVAAYSLTPQAIHRLRGWHDAA
jgi:hypothetical protein